jgi:hypothetical protein
MNWPLACVLIAAIIGATVVAWVTIYRKMY